MESERKFETIISGVMNARIMKMNNEKTYQSLILNMKHKNQKHKRPNTITQSVQNKSAIFLSL